MKSILTREKKSATVAEAAVQLVTFRVGTEEYGLDINSITEVIRPLKITPLPRMPEFVEGVINLRGTIIPIVDLRKRFALSEIRDDRRTMRMLITKGAVAASPDGGKGPLGLVVDNVHDVLHVPERDIEPAPPAATGAQAVFITGMAKVVERLIILLDISRILSHQERSALAEAGHADS